MKTVLQIALGIILAVVVLGGVGYGVYVANQPSQEEIEHAKAEQAIDNIKAIHKSACEKLEKLDTKKAQKCYAELNNQ